RSRSVDPAPTNPENIATWRLQDSRLFRARRRRFSHNLFEAYAHLGFPPASAISQCRKGVGDGNGFFLQAVTTLIGQPENSGDTICMNRFTEGHEKSPSQGRARKASNPHTFRHSLLPISLRIATTSVRFRNSSATGM